MSRYKNIRCKKFATSTLAYLVFYDMIAYMAAHRFMAKQQRKRVNSFEMR